VPVVDYDALRGSIERMAAGARDVLVATPVIAFEETGGRSGGAKLGPYPAAALGSFQRGLLPWPGGPPAQLAGPGRGGGAQGPAATTVLLA